MSHRQESKRIKIHKQLSSRKKCAENGSRSPKPIRNPAHPDTEREKDIFKVFQTFDLDGNGTISVKEMVTCLHAMGKKDVTFDDVLERFHRIDKDGNHEVDYEEFKSMMSS